MDIPHNYSTVPYKSYISNRFTHIAYIEYNSHFDSDMIDETRYCESIDLIPCQDNHKLIKHIGVEISIPRYDSTSEDIDEPRQLNSKFFALFRIAHELDLPVDIESTDAKIKLDRATLEAAIRTRMAVAAYIYNCGGDNMRNDFLDAQKRAITSSL